VQTPLGRTSLLGARFAGAVRFPIAPNPQRRSFAAVATFSHQALWPIQSRSDMAVEPSPHAVSADPAELSRLYLAMLRIRLFEDAVLRLFLANEVEGTTHLCQGQEAVAVGVCAALEPGDTVAATYRGHGAALALGVDATSLMAELLGRETGTNGGRGGSMNVTDLERGLIGCFGIVGGSIAAATGAALAAQLTRDGSVAVAFFGDGAVNQAYFHECLNFAAVRRLPVVYVCENNLYGEWTPMASVTAGADIAARGAAYAVPAQTIDGNDVLVVREAAAAALARARDGDGPTLLECLTYRHKGHSKVDAGAYRPSEEVEEWLGRDPLPRLAALLEDDAVERAHDEAELELQQVLEAARGAAFPTPGAPATAMKATR
jgi:TPP-dependent pyruvate/acetoin dehydrogenase alpha subunit